MFRTNQLIIIAGPSFSGKSFIIKKMRQGDLLSLREQLGITIPSSWLYVNANRLSHIRQPIVERLVVHYDFIYQYSQENGFKHIRELTSNADNITILTLCIAPELLVRRITIVERLKRLIPLLSNPRNYSKIAPGRFLKVWKKKRQASLDGKRIVSLYEKWFRFFDECHAARHWLLVSSEPTIGIAHPYEKNSLSTFTGFEKADMLLKKSEM